MAICKHRSYRAREVMTILENTEEVRNGEAAKHQAHGQQGGVGEGSFNLQLINGNILRCIVQNMIMLPWGEGVIHCVVQVLVVQDQRVGFENLR